MTMNLVNISVGCFVESTVVIAVEAVDLCWGSELRRSRSLNTSGIALERICVYNSVLESCLITNSTAVFSNITGTWGSAQAVCHLMSG